MLETILQDTAVFFGAVQLLGTAVVRYTMRFSAHCNPTEISMDELPEGVTGIFGPRVPELSNLGFELLGCYDCGNLTNETHSYVEYFCNRATNEFASVCALVTPTSVASYLEFSSSFANGMVLETNTNGALPLTPANRGHRVFRFPRIQASQELYRIHQQLAKKYAAGFWAQPEPKGEELQRYVRVIENYGPRHTQIGHMELSEDANWYKLTWKGAFLLTWRGLWPTCVLRRLAQRHAMQTELQTLQVRGVTALQKA
jgi:hypothetical protein